MVELKYTVKQFFFEKKRKRSHEYSNQSLLRLCMRKVGTKTPNCFILTLKYDVHFYDYWSYKKVEVRSLLRHRYKKYFDRIYVRIIYCMSNIPTIRGKKWIYTLIWYFLSFKMKLKTPTPLCNLLYKRPKHHEHHCCPNTWVSNKTTYQCKFSFRQKVKVVTFHSTPKKKNNQKYIFFTETTLFSFNVFLLIITNFTPNLCRTKYLIFEMTNVPSIEVSRTVHEEITQI